MIQEFAVILSHHRKLGLLLVPYVITGLKNQPFRRLEQQISPEIVQSCLIPLTEEQRQFVKLCGEYSERTLHKLFAKRKSVREFMDQMDDKLYNDQVRPYIERKLSQCLDFLRINNFPIYFKEKNYQVVYDEDLLKLYSGIASPLFHFSRSDNESKYFLTVQADNKELKLCNQSFEIITNQPCNVIINETIYYIDNIDAKKLLPFFTKEHISIPKQQEKNYFSGFVLNAIRNYKVINEGFSITKLETQRTAILSLENNLNEMPSFLLRYMYGSYSFTMSDSIEPKVFFEDTDNNYQYHIIERDPKWEDLILSSAKTSGLERNGFVYLSLPDTEEGNKPSLYTYINWLNDNKEKLDQKGLKISLEKINGNYFIGNINLDVKIKEEKDWFDVHAIVRFGEFEVAFSKLRKYILEGNREFLLPNGAIAIIPEEWLSRFRDVFALSENNTDQLKLHRFHYKILERNFGSSVNGSLDKLKEALSKDQAESTEVPDGLNATLRNYQKSGLFWMQSLYQNDMGGCLADDMGLGKTLQTISLLLYIKNKHLHTQPATLPNELFDIADQNGSAAPTSLIVMPVSLIHNWEKEIRRFAPSLTLHKFTGTQRTRNVLNFHRVDVILTSYGVVRNDVELLKKFQYHYIILDESQAIKNPDSKIYKAMQELPAEHRLVITGTPIENSLNDLWAQMNFVNRGILGSLSYFRDEFLNPIEKNQDAKKQEKLNSLINPFILRRTKESVAPELPEITEQVMYCEMSADQKHEYESEKSKIRNLILENIDKMGLNRSSIIILKGLNRLRLMANHPVLTDTDYQGDSGKFEEITRHIDNVVEEGHKLLIFSSYVKHLSIIEDYLKKKQWTYSILTGSTTNRAEVISNFTQNTDNKVFLISLKAGGTGLNLTAADYVFILDPWWNPAAEDQAISRAHRIGQEKRVFVYRFITRESIEEKILQLQDEKSALADMFINTNNPFRGMNRNEISELFD